MWGKLGQHFLINKGAIKKIVDALELKNREVIIEIGPGGGALTIPLAERCKMLDAGCQVIAIEKDPMLAEKLKKLKIENLEIVTEDVLKKLPKLTSHLPHLTSYKIVGNIPYYITGKLLRILSEIEPKPTLIVLMIQKEVAKRIVAQPPKMNLLAAITQFWTELKIIQNLKANDFSPAPKVDSTIIKLIPFYNKNMSIEEELLYFKMVKILFKQPRKTILNNLADGLKIPKVKIEAELKKIGLSGQERPQNLNIKTILELTNLDF